MLTLEMSRPVMETRPKRPVKQQQEYITEKKLFCCNTHDMFAIKNNLAQKHQKVMTLLHFTRRLVGMYSVGSKTKSIRPRLRPRPRPV